MGLRADIDAPTAAIPAAASAPPKPAAKAASKDRPLVTVLGLVLAVMLGVFGRDIAILRGLEWWTDDFRVSMLAPGATKAKSARLSAEKMMTLGSPAHTIGTSARNESAG